MQQLSLGFPVPAGYAEADFIPSPANQEALRWVEQWPAWGNNYGAVIYGPQGCGKTHLSHIWQERASAERLAIRTIDAAFLEHWDIPPHHAVVIDNLEKLQDEEALFHLLNRIKAQQGYVLFTSSSASLHFSLPDLRSRLLALPAIPIAAPDDDLLKAVLLKQCSDRQWRVRPEVLDYLLLRTERSFSAIHHTIRELDAKAWEAGRELTVPFVRKVLGC